MSSPKEKWLDFADQDATDLRDILVRSYGFLPENVTVLLNEQATKKGIEDALSALADEEKVKLDDRVLVFFSGHGQTVKLNDGTSRGFLIPFDAKVDLNRLNNAAPYLKTCLPMDSIWNYLEAIPARHRLLIADACFGGLLVKNKAIGPEKPNRAVVASLLTRPALQVLTAGDSGETVIEDPKLGHSAFTFKLLEELKAQAATEDQVFLTSQLAGALKTSVGNQTDG
ncbi:MAG: polysaccharide deacetylase, partial [Chthonomonadaceae bacterium]|nr:polysaccharide deacetylase [Chthonomonadaceae bacterium]